MECSEKKRLLGEIIENNQEYRLALERCRVCRTCFAAAPEDRTVCQLDSLLIKCRRANDEALKHFEEHGC